MEEFSEEQFLSSVRNTITSFNAKVKTDSSHKLKHSECFKTLAHELQNLVRHKVVKCILIAFSDLQECSDIFSCYSKGNRKLLVTHPDKIDRSRRHRIARGSGADPADVNRLLKDFKNMADMAQKMSGMGMMDRMKAMQQLTQGGMSNPSGALMMQKERSKRGPADPRVAEEKRKKARKDAKKQKKKNR